jgi:hypothetical protein
MTAAGHVLRILLPDRAAATDLATLVGRARRVDPEGAARLVVRHDVLAVYVSPVHGGDGPTVLGMRAMRVVPDVDVDVTVSLATLADRFARLREPGEPVALSVPPAQANASWAGVSPPPTGWTFQGAVAPADLARVAREGAAEVAEATRGEAGAHVVAAVRSGVWGRTVEPGLPAGAAFAAEVLGFLVGAEAGRVHVNGPWTRLTTPAGYVLSRAKPLRLAGA